MGTKKSKGPAVIFKAPPNPWFRAVATAEAFLVGFEAGTKLVVRQSRSGGWRVMSAKAQVVIADKAAARFLHTGKVPELVADQATAEAHFQKLLRDEDARGNAA